MKNFKMHGHMGHNAMGEVNDTGTAVMAPVEKTASASPRVSGKGYAIIAVIYLLGLFIGALDTGIVTPARTVIQNNLGVEDTLGVWMITIYTLAYAASIPVMGKLADRHGRKYIYILSVCLFGAGSLLCGLSQQFGSFYLLLGARVIQALGGGGIMPIATAEFGTAFPEEKRGMALGLVGAVYGVANVLGSTVGSAILDIFGSNNWSFIFYINIPICAFIIIAGLKFLPNTREEKVFPIDVFGILALTVLTLSLMYGLKNIDFFDATSIGNTDVYPFLLLACVMLPVFIFVERHAKDPVINLAYFKNRDIVITLFISIMTGIIMMGMIFIPQFAENALHLKAGDGGYMVMILALFSGVGAMTSGKLIDKFGVKIVLSIGFLFAGLGAVYLAYVTCAYPTWPNVIICLVLMGMGMGFTMGAPLNYMMLAKTDESESNSALATLSLVRSIGTAVAPAIMVAFIAHAGTLMQDRVMDVMPTEVTVSALPYAQELQDEFTKLQNDDNTKDMMADIDIPNLTDMQVIQVDMSDSENSGKYTVPDDVLKLMQDSNVTTITENSKIMASSMFEQIAPDLIDDIDSGIEEGKSGMNSAIADMDSSIAEMQDASDQMTTAIDSMDSAISQQQSALQQMQDYMPMLVQMENYTSVLDLIPDDVKASIPQSALDQLADVKTAADLQAKIDAIQSAMDSMDTKITDMQSAIDGIQSGIDGMKSQMDALQQQIDADETALSTENAKSEPDAATVAALEGKISGEQNGLATMKQQMDPQITAMQQQIASMKPAVSAMTSAVEAQKQAKSMMEEYLPTLQKLDSYTSVVDLMPQSAINAIPSSVLDELYDVKTSSDMQAKIDALGSAISEVTDARDQMIEARSELQDGIQSIQSAEDEINTTLDEMSVLEDAVPGSFDEAEQNYLVLIDGDSQTIEATFQQTLDEGFKGMFTLVAICSAIGLIVLMFYRVKDPKAESIDDQKKEIPAES